MSMEKELKAINDVAIIMSSLTGAEIARVLTWARDVLDTTGFQSVMTIITLASCNGQKIACIKAIRTVIPDCSLRYAKDIVDASEIGLVDINVPADLSLSLRRALLDAGATLAP